MPEPAGADHDAGRPGIQQRDRLLHRVIGGNPGIGERRDILRLRRRIELDAGAGGSQQVLGHPAIGGQPGERGVLAVHVIPGPAGAAQAAGRRRMQDDGVADGHVGDRGPDLVYPPGVLMPEDVRQRRVHPLIPLPLDDVQVGPAHPGPADLDDDIQGAADLRLGHVVNDRRAVKFVQSYGFH
jgi:hypothetical protein